MQNSRIWSVGDGTRSAPKSNSWKDSLVVDVYASYYLSRLHAPIWEHGSAYWSRVRKEVGSSKLQPQDMAKEFLRTLIQKYLCDELCHKKWSGKRVTQNSKERPPRAKAKSRGSPWWSSPTTLLSLSGCPFLLASHCGLEPRWHCMPSWYIYIYPYTGSRTRTYMHRVGIYAVWGLGPSPRIPTSSPAISLLPIPLHGLLLRSYGGGWGEQRRPDWLGSQRASRLLPNPENTSMMMVKGPWSHGPCAPSVHFAALHDAMQATTRSGKGLATEAERRVDKTQTRKTRGKG